VGHRSDKSQNAKLRSLDSRRRDLDHWIIEGLGLLIWHDEVQSLGVRTLEKGGELTCESLKLEVPKFLAPSNNQGHISGE